MGTNPILPNKFADNLQIESKDFWVAAKDKFISYAEDGNELCFQIEENSFWFRHRNNCLLSILERYPANGPLFDLGGGNGFVSWTLKKNGINSVVVEPGEQGARNALARGLKPVICSSFETAGFKPGVLPAVGLFDVVEHIEFDIEFLKKIFLSVAIEGRIYITVPAYQSLWSEDDITAGHFRRYRASSIKDALNQAGFEVESCTYIFSFLLIPIFLFRTIPLLLGQRKSKTMSDHKREHSGILAKLAELFLTPMLNLEVMMIRKGIAIPFGGSILLVARKS